MLASLPVTFDEPLDEETVEVFGLLEADGIPRFQTGLSIDGYVQLNAMFKGTLSVVHKHTQIGEARPDGSFFSTNKSSLLLEVSPDLIPHENKNFPLNLPSPLFVVYEGAELDASIGEKDIENIIPFFSFNSSIIPDDGNSIIENIFNTISDLDITMHLIGHTDKIGDQETNQALGQDRANAVKAAFVSLGVSDKIIKTSSRGETAPLFSDPDNSQIINGVNRRVEIIIIYPLTERIKPKRGDVIGESQDGITITVIAKNGLYLDPLALVMVSEINDPLVSLRDARAPFVSSNTVRRVYPSPNGAPFTNVINEPHYSIVYYESVTEAVNDSNEFDTIWLSKSPDQTNLNLDHSLNFVGQVQGPVTHPTISPAVNGSPIIKANQSIFAGDLSIYVAGLSFIDGRSPEGGGAIYAEDIENLLITDCKFVGNIASIDGQIIDNQNGGAIYLCDCKNILITDSVFYENKAEYGGGFIVKAAKN